MRRLALVILALGMLPGTVAAAPRFADQRLFTTPAERARLDELRAEAGDENGASAAAGGAEGEAAARRPVVEPRKPKPVKLRGFVRRSDGPGAVWVNDGSTLGGARLPEDIRVHTGRVAGDSVILTLPDGRTIRLKPGQTWDPESGRVDDYER